MCIKRIAFIICIFLCLPCEFVAAGSSDSSLRTAKQAKMEADLKSVLILKLVSYVDFPEPLKDDLQIAVIGDSLLSSTLLKYSGKVIDERKLYGSNMRKESFPTERLHIAIFSEVSSDELNKYMGSLKSLPVLTVGTDEGFLHAGGMIYVYTYHGRLRFDLNMKAINSVNLKMRASLIRLARNVIR